jgi:phosphonate transport system substrate-binding protein
LAEKTEKTSNLSEHSGKIIDDRSLYPFGSSPVTGIHARTFKPHFKKGVGLMKYRFFVRLIALSISLSWFVGLGAAETQKPLQIAILPCNNIEITFKKYYPLLKYLTEQTQLDVKLVVPADFTSFEASMRKGEIDFALQDPHTYLALRQLYHNDELLRVLTMDGTTTQSAVVVVRKDSGIKTLNDLRGRTVMFGPKSSTTKWVAAKLLFKEHGINIDKDLKAYANGGCCEDIAFNVFLRSVDAGVVCAHFLAEHEEKQKELGVRAGELLVIGKTKPVPTRVFAPRRDVSQDIISRLNHALLKLDRRNPEQAKILFRGESGGFQRAKEQDYEEVKRLMTSSLPD